VRRFETTVEAVVDGDVATLRRMLDADPELAHARSARRHHATLLHYVAANGVEDARQRTPRNALEVARLLLDAGADPDALAHMYDDECRTMSMLVSSSHPAEAGVQEPLAELLVDHGAALVEPGAPWSSDVMTALTFGYPATAQALVRRGAPVEDVALAAGLGRVDDVQRLLPGASAERRHAALALAAQLGHRDVVALLLDAGEDPDRYNPPNLHAHATPLHHAAGAGHAAVVRLLVERGARLDMRDTIYDATPLEWALHGRQLEIVGYLQQAAGGDAG
jgi:ankyrin repeat protein